MVCSGDEAKRDIEMGCLSLIRVVGGSQEVRVDHSSESIQPEKRASE